MMRDYVISFMMRDCVISSQKRPNINSFYKYNQKQATVLDLPSGIMVVKTGGLIFYYWVLPDKFDDYFPLIP